MTDLHPEVARLGFLVGTWRGHGTGSYPTIESFEYDEVVEIGHIGKPFLTYRQRTIRSGPHAEAGHPLHSEAGFIRPSGSEGVEWVIAQPTGVVEIHEGRIDAGTLEIAPVVVATTSTAVEVSKVERRVTVIDSEMLYQLWMEAVGEEHQLHLDARLVRDP